MGEGEGWRDEEREGGRIANDYGYCPENKFLTGKFLSGSTFGIHIVSQLYVCVFVCTVGQI